jgi:apolipoprotein D and lipocalin family protein
MKSLILCFTILLSISSFAAKHEQLPTVSSVEIERYVGKWYAHAALPQFFTRTCLAQTAEYEIIAPKTVSVYNVCLKKKGKTKDIEGQAVVTNTMTNAELEVTFNQFWTRLFKVKGDYNIIELDENYEYVMVGSNDRKSLWIMSRSEEPIPANIYDAYVKRAQSLGFKTKKLVISKF